MANLIKRTGLALLVLAIAFGFYLAMREKPISVETALADVGPMTVSIEEEGTARVRDVYTVSSPIAGHLDRTKLDEGEAVKANRTVIASIHPLDPPFLDERTRAELRAAEEAARSAIALAQVERTRAQMAFELAKSEYQRASKLAKTNVISDSQLERTYSDMKLQEAQVKANDAAIRLREAELASAQARLQQPSDVNIIPDGSGCCINLYSPVDGVVLKVMARSEQAVTQGMPITEVGDPADLEIAVDLLSSDAPKVKIGSRVEITDWGGSERLEARVRRIDPSAFTKISSLGIEEQRVNVILDLADPPDSLGHGYRVLARFEIWSALNALQVPIGALFRTDGDWAVFTVREGRAALQKIEVGHMNDESAEVLEGLEQEQAVILYPNDLLEDGSLIEVRE